MKHFLGLIVVALCLISPSIQKALSITDLKGKEFNTNINQKLSVCLPLSFYMMGNSQKVFSIWPYPQKLDPNH